MDLKLYTKKKKKCGGRCTFKKKNDIDILLYVIFIMEARSEPMQDNSTTTRVPYFSR